MNSNKKIADDLLARYQNPFLWWNRGIAQHLEKANQRKFRHSFVISISQLSN